MAGLGFALDFVRPDWPAPPSVRALSTTRDGGVSRGAYTSLNLGTHVGDDGDAVRRNRERLAAAAELTESPAWLAQVHGTRVVDAASADADPEADASICAVRGPVCAVLTADCLPVLLCDRAGAAVSAVHAGWRGLTGGVIESAVTAFGARGIAPDALLAWLGPAISARAYEVGEDVRGALAQDELAALSPNERGRWQLDLYALARFRLRRAGITMISGGDLCTLSAPERFFSYRRDGVCGRQATLIWLVEAD